MLKALRTVIRAMIAEEFVPSSGYDPESWYYDYQPDMSLQDILDLWQKQRPGEDKWGNPMPRQKMYDRSMPVMFDIDKIWPLREYSWTRESGRSGYVKGEYYNTPESKWDALKDNMAKHGWDPEDPLIVDIGKEGGVKVGEGNHRLAIARELGIKKVPVRFSYSSGKVSKMRISSKETKPKRKSKIPPARRLPKLSPEEEKKRDKLVQDIMDLL